MNDTSRAWIMLVVIVTSVVVRVAYMYAQERQESWTFATCYTNGCVKKTLDDMPRDAARDAKLTTWQDVTYVWYRR